MVSESIKLRNMGVSNIHAESYTTLFEQKLNNSLLPVSNSLNRNIPIPQNTQNLIRYPLILTTKGARERPQGFGT